MVDHKVVTRDEWLTARRALLDREKQEVHLRDAVNRERLALPWVRVDKDYRFEGPGGSIGLADLFDGRSQLIVYHFMLGPGWEAGCPGCSFLCDHIDGALAHLTHHDVTFTAVSRAPMVEVAAYKQRMGWQFPWVSSNGSDFNYDYHVSFSPEEVASGQVFYNFDKVPVHDEGTESPGMSAFVKGDDGHIYHTYSSYARGIETWIGTLMILDRAPLGRNEDGVMSFVRRHDEYQDARTAAACCH